VGLECAGRGDAQRRKGETQQAVGKARRRAKKARGWPAAAPSRMRALFVAGAAAVGTGVLVYKLLRSGDPQ
jgi:hypothetical protein